MAAQTAGVWNPILILALQAASAPGAVQLHWAPPPGSELVRRIDVELQGGLEDPGGGLSRIGLGGLASVAVVGRMRVVDSMGESTQGRPLAFDREVLELHTRWGGVAPRDVQPEVVGRMLRYAWDAETTAYEVTWQPVRRGAPAPPGLPEDLDARALLPERAVRVGETWRVPVSAVAPLLLPAGAGHVDEGLARAWKVHELAGAFDLERMQRIRDGFVSCRLVSVEGGLAVVEMGWTWWGRIDPFLTLDLEAWHLPLASGKVPLDVDARAWGRLTWDLEGGHARELELRAELDGLLGGWPVTARGTWWYAIEAR